MFRFLHTADWQIGMKATHVAAAAPAVRQARLDAARRLVERANATGVHALVVAGDLFEDNLVADRLVHEVLAILAASTAPVFVLPGNHDPLTPDSVWSRPSFRSRPAGVTLLDGPGPFPVPGADAVLVAAPLRRKKGFADPTRELAAPPGDAVAVGVAHGSLRVEGRHQEDDFPIALDAAERGGLDWLALGHWHGTFRHGARTAYSGTHEPTGFGEERSGHALLVEIASRGAAPKVEELATGVLTWLSLEADLTDGADAALSKVRARALALERPREALLKLTTVGHAGDDAEAELKALEEELAAKLLFASVVRSDLPAAAVKGRVAEIARQSALVAGLVADLASPPGSVASPVDVAARRLLDELVLEVWR